MSIPDLTGLYSSPSSLTDPSRKSAFAKDSYVGWDIGTTGGTNSIWRIYEGYTYPLLRNFLTPLTVSFTLDHTYNGNVASGTLNKDSYSYSIPGASLHTADIIGNLTYKTKDKNAGTYSVSNDTLEVSGLYSTQQGYDISYDGSLTINPATLTLTAASDTKIYDGTTFSNGTVSYSGLQTGDTITGLTQSFEQKHVLGTDGSTLIVSGYTINDGNGGNNYTVITQTATGTITPATLTVDLTGSVTKTYDGTTAAALSEGNFLIGSGYIAGDDIAVNYTSAAYDNPYIGSGKTVTVYGLTLSGNDASNYSLSNTSASAAIGTINPRPTNPVYEAAILYAHRLAAAPGKIKPPSPGSFSLTIVGRGINTGNIASASE